MQLMLIIHDQLLQKPSNEGGEFNPWLLFLRCFANGGEKRGTNR
jgi:hypothetical protein